MRNIFLDLHTLLRYRDCVLFSDNMSIEDTIYLGNMHNADAELQKKMNFMDFLRICRRTYYVEGHDKGNLEGDCSILQTWKLKCLPIWGKPAQKALFGITVRFSKLPGGRKNCLIFWSNYTTNGNVMNCWVKRRVKRSLCVGKGSHRQ